MKISITKTLALGGLCASFAGAAGTASAQGYGGMHHSPAQAKRHIQHLKAAYTRDVAHGNYAAAQKAHLKAKAIRHTVRAQREMRHYDMHHHGY